MSGASATNNPQSGEPRLSESEEIVIVDELGQGVLNSKGNELPYRTISISSEDLLAGDGGEGAELHPEDTDLDFELDEPMDEQQFEVVDTVDPVESQTVSHGGFQQECTGGFHVRRCVRVHRWVPCAQVCSMLRL